jgi:hypothetical protein
LALATAAPLLAWSGTPAEAWGWNRGYGYSGYNYCPPYRSYYYSYGPSYGYRPYYGAYWRPRYFTSSYFYRPYRPAWGWRVGYRPYRSWGWGRPYRAWGWGRPFRGGWGFHRGWRRW